MKEQWREIPLEELTKEELVQHLIELGIQPNVAKEINGEIVENAKHLSDYSKEELIEIEREFRAR